MTSASTKTTVSAMPPDTAGSTLAASDFVKAKALRTRRRVGQVLVIVAACGALSVSGWGMWHFFQDKVGLTDWYMIVPMFLLFDVAGIACAWNGRTNRIAYGRMGVEGWLVWLFATLSGLMSASDAHGPGARVRFAAPLVAAVMFELLIHGERRDAIGSMTKGAVSRLKRRLLARLGLLDALELDDAAAARAAVAGRVATLAYRMHQRAPGSRARRRAEGRYHRRLRSATERYRFATDAQMIGAVRAHLAARYQSVSGTSEQAVADLNVWRAADWVPRFEWLDLRADLSAVPVGVPALAVADVPAEVPSTDVADVPVGVPGDGSEDVPAKVPIKVPVRRSTGGSGRKATRKRPELPPRRSADETRRLAAELRAGEPTLTQAEIAAQLQISDRRLREVLAAPTTKVNGHVVPELIVTATTSEKGAAS